MATIYDIAKKSGYSTATVSRALGGFDDVRQTTKEKILKIAKELGYQPNLVAKSLTTKKSWSIGLLFSEDYNSGLKHSFFADVIDEINKHASIRGYDLTFMSNQIGKQEVSYLNHVKYRMLDGVIVVCPDPNEDMIQELVDNGIKVARIDTYNEETICVNSSNRKGIKQLVNHLYDKGYKKITYIHGQSDNFVTDQRIEAFQYRTEKLGIGDECKLIEGIYTNAEKAYELTENVMNQDNVPDAIMYSDDVCAASGLKYLIEHGYKVPKDIAICGYDGLKLSSLVTPSITTVRQRTETIGKTIINLLVDEIEGKKEASEKIVFVDVDLIENQTT